MRSIILVIIAAVTSFSCLAQQVRPANSGRIYNEIATLKNLTNVLYLAAHPDDENTRLLAWMANDQHINTAYLSLTRGDGGQNILGSEQGAALGLIRTHELMEARKIDGAGQFFSSAIDFGFSKNPDETFKHWNEEKLSSDVVWVIRKFRPDVIICRFPPTSEAGHGQHSASAILAAKAFRLAGDRLQFPKQLKYYPAWKPKRLLWNTFRFGDRNTTSENQFKIAVGQYSPSIGMGYGELAGISRSIHRSQGAGTPSVPGVQKEYFKLVDGDTLEQSFFDGIDISWNRVGRPEIGKAIDAILARYDFNHPEASLAALLKLRKEIASVKDEFWRKQKLEELDEAILHCTGFMAELFTKLPQAVAGEKLGFTLKLIARAGMQLQLKNIQGMGLDSTMDLSMANDSLYSIDHAITIPASQPLTQPYWLETLSETAQFIIPDDSLLGLPETPNNLVINLKIRIGDQDFTIPVPLSYKKLDPIKGDVTEALRIVPEVSVEPKAALLITGPDGTLNTTIHLHTYAAINNANLKLYANEKPVFSITNISLQANTDTTIPVVLTAAQTDVAGKDYKLGIQLIAGGKTYGKTLKLIQYDHIPTLQYLIPATAKVLRNDWKVTAKRIGFIEGAGEYTVTILREAGFEVDILKDADIMSPERLSRYDAIVTGIRAVNVEKRMSYWMPLLLEYVRGGGTLVMQYNTLQDLSTTNIGPYPFKLSGKRVTEEDADVEILSAHALLCCPNLITKENFKGWVQERGLYFPTDYDTNSSYTPLLGMHDTGEDNLPGSTLFAAYGKGYYIYTSLSFFRQLPAGNKGAIRLFMNMLSVGK